MKILLVNKFFFLKGGSEKCFFDTAELLQANGHSVIFFSMSHPDNRKSRYAEHFVSGVDFEEAGSIKNKLRVSARILYSREAHKKMTQLIREETPDLVHLHNIHHQISPSILTAIKAFHLPVVQTLHDYKVVCPVYTLLSRGKICERCRDKKYYHCTLRRCSKDSRAKSFLNSLEMYLHHSVLRIFRHVDAFISPSRFLKAKISDMGFRGDVFHLPNSVATDDILPAKGWEEKTVIYFGRLSNEKGIKTLVRAVKGLPVKCKIFGDGPEKRNLELTLRREGIDNVSLCGHVSQSRMKQEIQKTMFVILPSEWYENNPLAVIEAFAFGKPVIGSRIGGIPELITDDETGLTFEPGNAEDLRKKISSLLEDSEKIVAMGVNARRFVEQNCNPETHYRELMNIYRYAIDKKE